MIASIFGLLFGGLAVWLLIAVSEFVICFLLPGAFLLWMAMGFPEP
jgi:hypothetical protein